MDDLPEEPNLSLRISRFNDILISAAPTHIGIIWTLDDSTRARKNPYSKLPPSDNSSKSTGVDRCLSWSHQNYQQGQGRKLERSSSRRNVKFRRPKYMESHPRSERYSWCHLPLTKQCPTTAEPSQTSNLMPTYSLITTPGSANSTCHYPIETSTNNTRSVSMYHLLTMKVELPFTWDSYNLPSKRWKVKEHNILPSFLKSLGSLALQELLSIFNSSFSLDHCPCIWRVATIILLLKAGKSPSEVASFCPISLTSCFLKLLESIFADRLYYIAETNNLFSLFQVGFHKSWSCEDQITQIVISKMPNATLRSGTLDFSKAYDTVWREKLLSNMLDTGISSAFIRWIWSFFNNRRARVQLFNIFSSSRYLPKAFLKAPCLLHCYLASSLNNDAVIALFADNVSILTTACKTEAAEVAGQSVVNSVLIWSLQWKLNLNAEKSEVCSFSTWSNDSLWWPIIFIGTQKIRLNTTPHVLGIILDRSFTFNAH